MGGLLIAVKLTGPWPPGEEVVACLMLLLRQFPAGSNEGFHLLLLTLCLLLPALDLHDPQDDPVSILSTRHDLLLRLKCGDRVARHV